MEDNIDKRGRTRLIMIVFLSSKNQWVTGREKTTPIFPFLQENGFNPL
jgi:hypothetical protein